MSLSFCFPLFSRDTHLIFVFPSVGVWVMCFLFLASSHIASLLFLAPALPSLYDVFWLYLSVWACRFLFYSFFCVNKCLDNFSFLKWILLVSNLKIQFLNSQKCICTFAFCLHANAFSRPSSFIFSKLFVVWYSVVFVIFLVLCLLVLRYISCQFWVEYPSFFQASMEHIVKEKMPKKGGGWWFSWRSRNSDSKSVSLQREVLFV